jgi:nicotinamide mononucleotide transporter
MKFNMFEKCLIMMNVIVGAILLVAIGDYSWIAWVGLIASISNTVCVILVAKRKISNYIWGVVAVVAYGIVAFVFGNTGEWSLNWLYYFPMNIVGWLMWKRNKTIASSDESDVISRKLKIIQAVFVYGATSVCILLFAYLISLPSIQIWFYGNVSKFGFDKYVIDSFTTVLSVVAMILMVKRFREQWILWILVNVFSIIIWCYTFDLMMILMWSTLLVNSIYGYVKWRIK